MSKFISSLLFSATLLLICFTAKSQTSASVAPLTQCYNASNIYTINAGLFLQVSGAAYYQWTITSNNNCTTTFTNGQFGGPINTANTGSQIAITASCCGLYSYTMMPYNLFGSPMITGACAGTFEIVCPYSPTVVASATTACEGQSITVSELGGNAPGNYNWFVNGTPLTTTASSIALTPSVNTCITFSPNSVQGCTNALISAACVSVQASQLALGNLSYTLCNNVPLCLTLPAQTNTNVAAGTSSPSITWLAANNTTLTSPCMLVPIPGTYTAVVSHTGAAGTCTRTSMLSIATGTALSVAVSPSVSAICNSTTSVPLSATSIQSVSSSYTWSIPNGTQAATTQTGSTIFGTANFLTGTAKIYSVTTSYSGCVGTNTVLIKPFNINPVITAATNSICVGTLHTLSTSIAAGQLSNYAITYNGPGNTNVNTNASGLAVVSPSALPVTYTVTVDSANCSATNSITLYERILKPKLVLSNDTICKGTFISMTCQNVGYAITNSYSFGILSPSTASMLTGGPTFSIAYNIPPVTTVYYVVVDSAGCNNMYSTAANASVVVKPSLQVLPNVSSATVCPGTSITLSATLANPLPWPVTYTWTQTWGFGTFGGPTNSSSVQAYPVNASIYSVHMQNPFGCGGDTTINVNIDYNLGFPMSLSASSNPLCESSTIVLTSSVTTTITGLPLLYNWITSTGSFSTINTQSVSVTPTASTIYTLVASNQHGCTNQSTIAIVFADCSGIDEKQASNYEVVIAPNPASDKVKITLPENALLTCYSLNGKVLFKSALSSGDTEIDLRTLEQGIYFFEFNFETKKVFKKILVR